MATVQTWIEVYRSPRSADCDERLLLLESVGIPAAIRSEDGESGVWVAPDDAGRAYFELTRYSTENRPAPPPVHVRLHRGAAAAAAGYVALVFVLTSAGANALFGMDWLAAGALDGARVRSGEWWRAVTALTLHADLAHLAANAGFGALFGTLAGRVYGPGRAWLMTLAAAVLANLANAAWMPAGRISLGASTAVFASLGLLCVWRWPAATRGMRAGIRGGSVVAAVVLLALLGTGDERTDIAAHLLGFLFGAGLGALPVPPAEPGSRVRQRREGALAAVLVLAAWSIALLSRATT